MYTEYRPIHQIKISTNVYYVPIRQTSEHTVLYVKNLIMYSLIVSRDIYISPNYQLNYQRTDERHSHNKGAWIPDVHKQMIAWWLVKDIVSCFFMCAYACVIAAQWAVGYIESV